jgi:hypothetical protein
LVVVVEEDALCVVVVAVCAEAKPAVTRKPVRNAALRDPLVLFVMTRGYRIKPTPEWGLHPIPFGSQAT